MSTKQLIDGSTWATLSPDEKLALWNQISKADRAAAGSAFRERCEAGTLSPSIARVGLIKGLTTEGDLEVRYPQVDISQLPSLEPDEVAAVAAAEMVIYQAQQQRAAIVGVTPGSGTATRLPTKFNVATAAEVITILNPLIGG